MHISAFDLDHTLFKSNSSFSFGRHLYSHSRLTTSLLACLIFYYGCHTCGLVSINTLHQLNFDALFKGRPLIDFEELAVSFINRHMKELIYPPVAEAFSNAKKAGHYTALISASPDFLVALIAKRFGFDHYAATHYQVNESGCFESLGEIMDGALKAAILTNLAKRLKVPRECVYAYSDSHLDIPFLQAAGHSVAVRPDRQLKKISIAKGWKILN